MMRSKLLPFAAVGNTSVISLGQFCRARITELKNVHFVVVGSNSCFYKQAHKSIVHIQGVPLFVVGIFDSRVAEQIHKSFLYQI